MTPQTREKVGAGLERGYLQTGKRFSSFSPWSNAFVERRVWGLSRLAVDARNGLAIDDEQPDGVLGEVLWYVTR